MSQRKRKPSPFQNCETKEDFLAALTSGKLTPADYGVAKMLCKMKGWDTPEETSEASVTPEVTPTVAAPSGGDGFWYWRDDIDGDREAVIQVLNANVDYPRKSWREGPLTKKQWQGPLTTAEMATKYNEIAAANSEAVMSTGDENVRRWLYICGRNWNVDVITPKGLSTGICCELPCTVAYLEAKDEEPPRDINDPW